jgi:hypothetical protein
MKPSWMSDARQIPDEVMTYLRQIIHLRLIFLARNYSGPPARTLLMLTRNEAGSKPRAGKSRLAVARRRTACTRSEGAEVNPGRSE